MPSSLLSSVFDASPATIVALILGLAALILVNVYQKKSLGAKQRQRQHQGEGIVICGPSEVGKTSLFLLVHQGCLPVEETINNNTNTHIPLTTISAECNSCKIRIGKEALLLVDEPYHQRDKVEEAAKIILVLDGVRPIGKEEVSWISFVLAERIKRKSAQLLIAISKADLIKSSPMEVSERLKDDVNRQLARQFEETDDGDDDDDATSLAHLGNKNLRVLRRLLPDDFRKRPFDFFSSKFKIIVYSKNSLKDLQEIISWLK